jgi:hypothetical protein
MVRMTKGKLRIRPRASCFLLSAIVLGALALRLHGVTFGLPSMYDHDEPLFAMIGVKLIAEQTLNPGWFGHPGTTTVYALALVDLGVIAWGFLTGAFHDATSFAVAIYRNPSLIFLPNRLLIVGFGVLCVLLTAFLGKRLFGRTTGWVAAALLAVMPLHVEFSQIIRTDIHATVFMLACLLFTLRFVDNGQRRQLVIAAVMVGLATATKWPASVAGLSCIAACVLAPATAWKTRLANAVLACAVAVLTLLLVSPFLLLDYPTLLSNLGGEARGFHLGATGGTLLWNLAWYFCNPLFGTLGMLGLLLGGVGAFIAVRDHRARIGVVIVPIALLYLIAAQSLIWARWVLPLLPFFALFIALAIVRLGDLLGKSLGPNPARIMATALGLGVAVPMLVTANAQATERLNDTRDQAADWVLANVPKGQTIVLEHLAIKLAYGGWQFRYSLGEVGCIDGAAAMGGRINFKTILNGQGGRAMINLGTVNPVHRATCWGDYAILTEYDRFVAERENFPGEVANYGDFFRYGQEVAVFRPEPGKRGGPVVRIVKLDRRAGLPAPAVGSEPVVTGTR